MAVGLLTPAIAAGDGGHLAPSAPSSFSVTGASTSTISLSWSPSTGATSYLVNRDGNKITITSSTSYTISGLDCGKSYTLGVIALAPGTHSSESKTTGSTSSCAAPGGGGSTGGGSTGSGSTGGVSTAGQVTKTFSVSADARVEEGAPGTNFGKASSLRAEGGSDPDSKAFLRFDVSGLSGAATSAKLRLYATSDTVDGPAVYSTGSGWSESAITFSNHPGSSGGALSDSGAIATGAWTELNVSSVVSANGTYNLVLVSGSNDGVDFASKESGNGPQLVVTTGSSGGGGTGGGGHGTPPPEPPQVNDDTQAPTVPTGLTKLATTVTSIVISWKASTDDVGVKEYGVYLNGSLVQNPTNTTHLFGSLSCGTSYALGVDAVDQAGNRSDRALLTASTNACGGGEPPPPPPPPPPASCSKVASPGQGTAQALVDSLSAGQTGCLRGGTYTASGSYVLETSKSSFTLTSYPGERALLKGIVKIRTGANKVRLSSLDFEGTGGENAIVVYGTQDFVLEDSDVTNKWRGKSCMSLGNPSIGVAVRPTVRRNMFHECGDLAAGNQHHGIYVNSTLNGLITQNVFYNMAAYAMQLYPNTHNTIVSHNVIDGAAPSVRGGIVFGGDGSYASTNNIVEFNVVAYAAGNNIRSSWSGAVGTGNIARNNCVFGASQGDIGPTSGFTSQNNTVADPLFVNRSARDYRLKSGSQCFGVVGYDAAALVG